MRSGTLCIASALYRPECGCDVVVEVQRGEPCPPCPQCGRAVNHLFVRSLFASALRDGRHEEEAPERRP